jgi:hypothetical protein
MYENNRMASGPIASANLSLQLVAERGALAMNAIPLHLQRRFEQRWAAKLASLASSTAPKSVSLKRIVKSSPRPAKAKEEPAGLKQRA